MTKEQLRKYFNVFINALNVKNNTYLNYQHRDGVEYQNGITEKNIEIRQLKKLNIFSNFFN